jgi:hypothetical protein
VDFSILIVSSSRSDSFLDCVVACERHFFANAALASKSIWRLISSAVASAVEDIQLSWIGGSCSCSNGVRVNVLSDVFLRRTKVF